MLRLRHPICPHDISSVRPRGAWFTGWHPPRQSWLPDMADRADSANELETPNTSLPYELLREIFHQATFIPHEWDVNATSIIPGLFCIRDQLQLRAWREILPLRRAIAQVSSQWRAIALEFLYGTFHDDGKDNKLEAFDSILSDCPHYAKLVKRLSMRLRREPDHNAQVARVLLHCPNLLIIDIEEVFGHDRLDSMTLSNLTDLSTTIRQLDLTNVPTNTVFTVLNQLPNLEILSISEIDDDVLGPDWTCPPFTVLPNLRILQLLFATYDDIIEVYMKNLKAPRLTSLSIRTYSYSIPKLPDEMAHHLLYLEFVFPHNWLRGWRADDLPNLRCLQLRWQDLSWDIFRSHLPMKQIVELTCNLPSLNDDNLLRKRPLLDGMIGFTLDPNLMPNLKSFTLDMENMTRKLLSGEEDTGSGLRAWFTSLITAFDQRGVDLYFYPADLLHGKVLMGDILEA